MTTGKLISILLLSVLLLASFILSPSCSNKSQTAPPTQAVQGTSAASSNIPKSTVLTSSSKPTSTKATSTGTVIKLKTISFIDQQGIGTEAFNMLIPIDWQYEGGIQWLMDPPNMPAITRFRVWNPAGTEEFEVFPSQALYWTNNPLTMQLFPVGSKYFGNEIREPLQPVAALKQIVIPKFFSGVQGLKIVKEEDISNVVLPSGTTTQAGLPTSTEVGRIRVEYTKNGRLIEDEIYCAVEATQLTETDIMWGVNYICSFRAEKGKLDPDTKIFQTISNSVTLNVKWFNTYVQVIEYLIKMQIQQIHSIGELGSIIAQTGSEIRQENLDLYYQREAMNDRISTQFSEYVRGVDSYYNPLEEKNIELPTGYDNVWVNGNGEYVLTDNPNYNPNIGNNQNFQRLEKAKP